MSAKKRSTAIKSLLTREDFETVRDSHESNEPTTGREDVALLDFNLGGRVLAAIQNNQFRGVSWEGVWDELRDAGLTDE